MIVFSVDGLKIKIFCGNEKQNPSFSIIGEKTSPRGFLIPDGGVLLINYFTSVHFQMG